MDRLRKWKKYCSNFQNRIIIVRSSEFFRFPEFGNDPGNRNYKFVKIPEFPNSMDIQTRYAAWPDDAHEYPISMLFGNSVNCHCHTNAGVKLSWFNEKIPTIPFGFGHSVFFPAVKHSFMHKIFRLQIANQKSINAKINIDHRMKIRSFFLRCFMGLALIPSTVQSA